MLTIATSSLRRVALALAVCAATASAAGCSSDPEPSIRVSVTIDVCSGEDCFAAPVPDAEVTVEGSEVRSDGTDADGQATIDVPEGEYVVQATWAGLSGESTNVTVDTTGVDVTIRLLPSVQAN